MRAWRVLFAAASLTTIGLLAWLAVVPAIIGYLYAGFSVATYIAYAIDKRAAAARRWRTPESTLQWLAFLGGWPGALLAQETLHHKSRKATFQGTFWFVTVVNIAAVTWLLSPYGEHFLARIVTG